MPTSNVSGSNFTTLYSSSQGNTNPYVPIPPSNANVSGQNYTTLYSAGSGTAPVPIATYGNANVESFLAVGSDTGGNVVGNISSSGAISATGNITTDQYFIGTFLGNITGNFVVPGLNTQVIYNNNGNAGASSGLTFVATSNTLTSGNVISAVGNIQGGNIRTAGQVSATGNVTGNYFIGNGSQLTGLPATYGNANVANYLPTFGGNVNATTIFHNTTGVAIQSNAWAQLQYSNSTASPVDQTNIGTGSWFYVDPSGAAWQSNTTGTVQTVAFNNDGSVSATGNITAPYYFGNGSQLTGLPATYSNANVTTLLANFGSNTISTTGNITAGYFIGNGSALTSITAGNITGTVANATYALNANAATYATNAVQANVANVANSVAGANVTGTVANAAYALNSNAATFAGTVTTAAQPNITSVGILTVINTSGNISATGNITGNVFSGNGAGLTNINAANIIGAYGNANVAANLAAFANNPISTSGNITAGYFIGNGAALTSLTGANVTGVVANATYAVNANAATYATDAVQANYANIANSVAGANVSGTVGLAQYVTQNAQANITSVGTLTSLSVSGNTTSGNISAVGNINGANLNISNDALILGNLTVNGNTTFINSNVVTINDKFINLANNAATPSAANGGGIGIGPIASEYATLTYDYLANTWNTNIGLGVNGNVTANYFIGNGSALSSITGGNVTGTVANATYALNANAATFAGTVTTNAQPNITSVGILTEVNTSGNVSATGNITGNVFTGNAAGLTNIPGGNVTGTVPLAQYVTQNAQANITSVGVLTALSVSGNITSGNITNNGTITSVGNITAPNFIGNVIGNIDAGGANTQVQFNDSDILNGTAGFTFDKTSNAVAIVGNVNAGNLRTAGQVSATGNVLGGNIIIPNGGKYRGDFSSAPASGRTLFQTTSTGTTASTFISVIPGPNHTPGATTTGAATGLFSTNDVGNAAVFGMYSTPSDARIWSLNFGTGNVNDITFRFGSVGTLGATVTQTGNISAVGNVSGNYIIGDGSALTNITGANITGTVGLAQYVTQNAQANITSVGTLTSLSVSGNVDAGNLRTAGLVTATGNVSGGNIIVPNAGKYRGDFTSAPASGRTLFQTTSTSTTASTFISVIPGPNHTPGATTTGAATGLFSTNDVGNASVFGMYSTPSDARIWSLNFGTGNVNDITFRFGSAGTLAATVTQTGNISAVGNVSAANFITAGIVSAAGNIVGGNVKTAAVFANAISDNGAGDITVNTGNVNASGNINVTKNLYANTISAGTFISTPALYTSDLTPGGGGPLNTTTTLSTINGNLSVTGTITGSGNITGGNLITTGQSTLGALKTFSQNQYTLGSSGTINIDKNNGQVQYIAASGNVTIGSFTNFVTTAGSGNQTDTVTVIVRQGSPTAHTITMPTGNASIKYAANLTTVGTTANSVTMFNITAANVASVPLYMITISPEFI
jgi:hypothetical protein